MQHFKKPKITSYGQIFYFHKKMAGLNRMKEFITSNWDGDIIHIPVSTEKTLIENAELYYVKLRNAHQSAKIRQQRIPIYEKELATLKGWIATLNNNTDLATLEELYQKVFKTSTKKIKFYSRTITKISGISLR